MSIKTKTIGYLRVSTVDQDLDKFKADILRFTNERNFGQVIFVEETISARIRDKKPFNAWEKRKIGEVINQLSEGDRLITPELSRLGRSTLEVLQILKQAKEKGIDIFSVKEGLALNGDGIQAKVMATILALVAELESDFISMRTKEGLKAARAKGKLLGRPKGPGKSKLDPHREEIQALLKTGSTRKYVAKKYGVTPSTLTNWIQKKNVECEPEY